MTASKANRSEVLFQSAEASALGRVSVAARMKGETLRGVRRRRMDCFALVLLVDGSGRFRDEHGTAVTLGPGDAWLVFPGVQHTYVPDRSRFWSELFVLFDGPVFALWQRRKLLNPQRPLYRLDPVPYWESRIAAVWKESGSALDRVLRMQQLLAEMGDARDAASMDQRDRQWLNEARSRLEAHAANPDAVQAVAGEMGMSYQVFRKTFSRLHGCGPFRFCSERRMQLAAGRLLTDSVPVKALAAELGYCDEFHFSRRFRQIHGVSPDAYRRRMHAQDRSARQD